MQGVHLCTRAYFLLLGRHKGFPGGAVVNNPLTNAGDTSLIPGSGRSLGEGNGNPLQYYCLANSMDRGTRQATVHGVTKSQTRLNNGACMHTHSVNLNFNTYLYTTFRQHNGF